MISRRIIEVVGDDYENTIDETLVSSQSLSGTSGGIDDFSVFFRLASVGGSGATFYYFLAFADRAINQRVYGLNWTSDEGGTVELDDSGLANGYMNISVYDSTGSENAQWFVYSATLKAYVDRFEG